MTEKLITIAVFNNVIDAHILKSKLEFENIQCFLLNEHLVSRDPLSVIAYGGVEVQVRSRDAKRASEIYNAGK